METMLNRWKQLNKKKGLPPSLSRIRGGPGKFTANACMAHRRIPRDRNEQKEEVRGVGWASRIKMCILPCRINIVSLNVPSRSSEF